MQTTAPYFSSSNYGNQLINPPFRIPSTNTCLLAGTNIFAHQPNVAGEGDVTTVLFPDGTFQLFFTPSSQFPPNSHPYANVCPCCVNHYVDTLKNTWFIKSISNPITPTAFAQQFQNPSGRFPPSRTQTGGYILYNGYQLKFHNDSATSTTDLMYFYPCARSNITCCAVQVDTITKTSLPQTCTKPCCSTDQYDRPSCCAHRCDEQSCYKKSEKPYCDKPCCSKSQVEQAHCFKKLSDSPAHKSSTMSMDSLRNEIKNRKVNNCQCRYTTEQTERDDACKTRCGCDTHATISPKFNRRKFTTVCPCASSSSTGNDSEPQFKYWYE